MGWVSVTAVEWMADSGGGGMVVALYEEWMHTLVDVYFAIFFSLLIVVQSVLFRRIVRFSRKHLRSAVVHLFVVVCPNNWDHTYFISMTI